MRLIFTSPDIANTTLINASTKKPVYEVLSSPPTSAERFTTLRHSPPQGQGKERWEGKFVGSIEWGSGLLDEDEKERLREDGEDVREGWVVWGKPEAEKRELGSLLRPIDGKGKMARVFTGYMRADYIWQIQRSFLPHRTAVLQLVPALSPDTPIATYHPPSTATTRAAKSEPACLGSGEGKKKKDRPKSFSLSRSSSRKHPAKPDDDPTSTSAIAPGPSANGTTTEPDAPFGSLEISPRAIEMLDLVLLTFLALALSPSSQSHLQRSGSLGSHLSKRSRSKSRSRVRSPPGSGGSALSWPGSAGLSLGWGGIGEGRGSASVPGSTAVSSAGTGSAPSTPDDEEGEEDHRSLGSAPASTRPVGKPKGWREMLGLHSPANSPSTASLVSGWEAGVERLRRFSFPGIGRGKVDAATG